LPPEFNFEALADERPPFVDFPQGFAGGLRHSSTMFSGGVMVNEIVEGRKQGKIKRKNSTSRLRSQFFLQNKASLVLQDPADFGIWI
jgi:hypothetical protein